MNDSYQPIYDAAKRAISHCDTANEVRRAAENAFGYHGPTIQGAIQEVAASLTRPYVLFRPKLVRDHYRLDGHWLAAYSGVEAHGTSPAEAMAAFDRAWEERIPEETKKEFV